MNISNVMGSADTSVVAASKKNKWKLTDSLKDKIAEMAKKDAQNNAVSYTHLTLPTT